MKVFLTGATGYIGASIVKSLLRHGHNVMGLARSASSADKLEAMGVEPYLGSIDDLDSLAIACSSTDSVIHAAFNYDDWGKIAEAFKQERAAVTAMLSALSGTDKPFLYTSGAGTVGDTGSIPVDEDFKFVPEPFVKVRAELEKSVLAAAANGVRSSVIRPGLVYGRGGSGIVNLLITLARNSKSGVTFGDGQNQWSVVHVDDLGDLYALAIESAPAGSVLHASVGAPVAMADIAATISQALGFGGKVESWSLDQARKQFSFADSIASEKRISSVKTTDLLHWQPHQVDILSDLRDGSYNLKAAE